ncbi:cytochrome c biogenesis protein CcsA [Arundinibacter roseus]|uniref:ABC transporter permease n=1 Tax=Arundinibacter roseus TaxID=2070510 RepID=A0A4R4KIV1_9BACT|nr:cytochrome c biogenesis protein CcsA [Arundinibacter roseus]TDB68187.1 ABC transporter permease [Arundinibacter roseus]
MKNWWKILTVIVMFYVIFQGLLGTVPRQPILNESIRNLYFHVTMWFAMISMLLLSVIYSVRYLRSNAIQDDERSAEFAKTGILFGVLGCVTGSLWANFTWGEPWPNDPKLNSAAVGMLIYFAYLLLRNSFEDEQRRGRISAVYNIFAFAVFVPLIFVLPRLTDSLHPGNGGNPAFSSYDLDNQMRLVFYPASIGWILLGLWITQLRYRLKAVHRKQLENLAERPLERINS